MKHWMFRCDDVAKRSSQGMDADLPLITRLAIRFHLWMCRSCKHSYLQMYFLRKISRQNIDLETESEYPPEFPDKLSPEARERIKSELRCQGNDAAP